MAKIALRSAAYRGLGQAAAMARARGEGWDPAPITDPPGFIYPTHRHATAKLLVVLHGTMEVIAGGRRFDGRPGDALVIPGNVEHAAVVGPEGCAFLWSEQLREIG